MPLPIPLGKESKQDFIGRCMGDSKMNEEYPESSQRFAICRSLLDDKKVSQLSEDLSKK